MTDKDIIIIYTEGIFTEADLQKYITYTKDQSDETTKIITIPTELTDKVERL